MANPASLLFAFLAFFVALVRPLQAGDSTFPNPLIPQRADPHIFRHTDGNYYFMGTVPEYDRLELRRAPTIAGLATAEARVIWRKHATGVMGAHIWAPEIHFIEGKWYIYFAAGEAEKIWNIRIYVLENASANPLDGEWIERGQLKTQWESFALDATTFVHHGQRYLLWAQHDPALKNNTDLYLAKMDSPVSLTGTPLRLSTPEYDWEKVRYQVNEGPAVLQRNGRIFVTYSAAGTGAEYCLGLLTARDEADLLDPKSWTKSPTPVFSTSEANHIYGPGHNSFTTDADGSDVLVYHARTYRDIVGDPLKDPNRHARVQAIRWRADGTPDFGTPCPDDAMIIAPWMPDLGDGTYRNPVLFADYSDPDAIRVGDDYYLTSSSFLAAPGLPILHSKDLVNWTIINHVFAVQQPADHFAKPRHGQGVWAPAIRHHAGKFWIFYPDPDFGIYVTTATDPAGQWSPPFLLKAGKGLIDPCPFWDDDGTFYFIHGWARSRSGIANLLTLHTLSADGTRILDAGKNLQTTDGKTNDVGTIIIDANKLTGWNTLEGPKLYKRDGWYYVFAPAGGVATGYQAIFRARDIRGPYEGRIVLDQGSTTINGPHQGAWVDTPSGEDWFLHFQDRGPYGRVVHLQPMAWRDGWPLMGTGVATGAEKGEPVLVHKKPNVPAQPATAPQTSDEFNGATLGRQWQWNANPGDHWASLTAKPGSLRLTALAAPATRNDGSPAPDSLYDAPNFLAQKFSAPAFTATTVLDFAPVAEGETAGLAVIGYNYTVLGLRKDGDHNRLVLLVNLGADKPGAEHREVARVDAPSGPIYLRVTVNQQALCQFAWSADNQTFMRLGEPFPAAVDRWIGARVGLIATAPSDATKTGHADFDWFRVTRPQTSGN